MNKKIVLAAVFSIIAATLCAQAVRLEVTGKKVSQVELRDLSDEPIPLPGFGEKPLLIFYVDPDARRQNKAFTNDLASHLPCHPAIEAYGVINLKDTELPDRLIRSVSRAKEKKNGAPIYTDPDRLLSRCWGLGDCNGKFIILLVTREGRVVFARWGEFDENDKKDFYAIVGQYL